jgi:hypothetical protein
LTHRLDSRVCHADIPATRFTSGEVGPALHSVSIANAARRRAIDREAQEIQWDLAKDATIRFNTRVLAQRGLTYRKTSRTFTRHAT